MININVKLFASAKDIAGTGEMQLSLADGASAGAVLDALIERYPELGEWKSYVRLAVNQEYSANEQPLHDRDEVAIIPPVSGG